MRHLTLAAACCLVAAAGCVPIAMGARPSHYTAHLAQQGVSVQAPMVAHPIARTLVVLIDPSKVPDAFPVTHTPGAVDGFRHFVAESLAKTLGPYFQSVVIAKPNGTPPAGPYVVAVVKVPGINAHNLVVGYLNYAILHMDWAVAFRAGEGSDYLFSFAGEATSDNSYRSLDQGCRQTMRAALGQLLKAWADKNVYTAIRSLPAPPSMAGGVTGGGI